MEKLNTIAAEFNMEPYEVEAFMGGEIVIGEVDGCKAISDEDAAELREQLANLDEFGAYIDPEDR